MSAKASAKARARSGAGDGRAVHLGDLLVAVYRGGWSMGAAAERGEGPNGGHALVEDRDWLRLMAFRACLICGVDPERLGDVLGRAPAGDETPGVLGPLTPPGVA